MRHHNRYRREILAIALLFVVAGGFTKVTSVWAGTAQSRWSEAGAAYSAAAYEQAMALLLYGSVASDGGEIECHKCAWRQDGWSGNQPVNPKHWFIDDSEYGPCTPPDPSFQMLSALKSPFSKYVGELEGSDAESPEPLAGTPFAARSRAMSRYFDDVEQAGCRACNGTSVCHYADISQWAPCWEDYSCDGMQEGMCHVVGPCTGGEEQYEEQLDEVVEAYNAKDWFALANAVVKHSRWLTVNWEREAVQAISCDGGVVEHLALDASSFQKFRIAVRDVQNSKAASAVNTAKGSI